MELENKLTAVQKQILVGLNNKDDKIVIKTIKDCRDKGGEYVIEPLMEVYFSHSSENVIAEIPKLFSDLKENKFNRIITDNLTKYKRSDRMTTFVSAMWESAIKFEDTKVLLDIFISGTDATSIEALTLIQQNADVISDEMKSECLDILKSELLNMTEFRKNLSIDLLEVFE